MTLTRHDETMSPCIELPPFSQHVQCWRWRFPYPAIPLTAAVRVGQALRRAVFEAHGRRAFPNDFHEEAYWLVEDEDEDGVIDHALAFHARGLAPEIVAAMAHTTMLWFDDVRTALLPDWMGRRAPGGLFGPAEIWEAATPFVPPLWRSRGAQKAGQAPREAYDRESQLRESPALRNLGLIDVEWAEEIRIGDVDVPARAFETQRILARTDERAVARGATPPGDARAAMGFPALRFEVPVWGPLAVGFGAHFGLGLLRPVA
jgi:CRISPR-associated protein Csb2